ncbi:MAG TPA: hypothetical protein VII49_08970 [Rhizomicrobium sp.]
MAVDPQPERRIAETAGPDRHASKLPAAEARQGETTGRMRYVLGIGVALIVLIFAAIYFFYF